MSLQRYRFMSPDEQADAEAIGARKFLNNKRYRAQRDRLFALLDEAVAFMANQKFGDPYNGHLIGGFAQAATQADSKSVGVLKSRKVAALNDPAKRRRLFELIGLLIAEEYLKDREEQIPAETKLSVPAQPPSGLRSMLGRVAALGEQFAQEDHYSTEMAVRFPMMTPSPSGRR